MDNRRNALPPSESLLSFVFLVMLRSLGTRGLSGFHNKEACIVADAVIHWI